MFWSLGTDCGTRFIHFNIIEVIFAIRKDRHTRDSTCPLQQQIFKSTFFLCHLNTREEKPLQATLSGCDNMNEQNLNIYERLKRNHLNTLKKKKSSLVSDILEKLPSNLSKTSIFFFPTWVTSGRFSCLSLGFTTNLLSSFQAIAPNLGFLIRWKTWHMSWHLFFFFENINWLVPLQFLFLFNPEEAKRKKVSVWSVAKRIQKPCAAYCDRLFASCSCTYTFT